MCLPIGLRTSTLPLLEGALTRAVTGLLHVRARLQDGWASRLDGLRPTATACRSTSVVSHTRPTIDASPKPAVPMDPLDRAFLANVMDLMLDAVCVVDGEGRFVFVSAAGERIFGYTPQELIGRPMIELVHPDDRERTLNAVAEVVADRHLPIFENRYLRKDGRVVHLMWSARWSPADGVRVAVARDVSARKRAESVQAALYAISEAAHAAEDLMALFAQIHRIIGGLLPAKNFFVALYDAPGDWLSFPYFVDEHDAAPPPGALDAETLCAELIRSGRERLLSRDSADAATSAVHPDVGRSAVDWLGVPLSGSQGVIGALVLKSHSQEVRYGPADVELLKFVSAQVAAAIERKQSQLRLLHVAQHDALTGLPNRSLVRDRVATALARARRDGAGLALLYLDLDQFKPVNDRCGHAVGDGLLQQVAQRLKHCVRASDTVGRMAGDEFVVLLSHLHAPDDAPGVAEKIRQALCRPFEVAGHTVLVSPSIGLVGYPAHGEDADQLVQRADEAMYAAKRAGGNRVCVAGGGRPPGG
ncbi:diguanylate cyclase with PAS/PAC and GAF sensors [Rubrivivax benzoatilyticus JA2 = ATCC BAA-35]|nr:diguanylate cyclase with PAS/PAC and GAF sensors [Rubrivivax benzoatilyticus JA2 = ATCC BAA-35]